MTQISKQSAERLIDTALTRAGAAVMKERMAREAVAKELDQAAERLEAKAGNRRTSVHNEVSDYYRLKAASARARANELRENK
jgi:cyclopropane fatty-acyl-phospholipid synthase-like methyltransferase